MSTIAAAFASELLEVLDQIAQILITDRHERIVAVNRTFCEAYGYEPHEVIGQTPRLLNSGTHPRRVWQDMRARVQQGGIWRGQVCNRTRSGALLWVDMMVAPLPGADGYIGIAHDITERVRQQGRIAVKERLLRGASQLAQLGAWGVVLNHDSVYWTADAARLLGLPAPGTAYLSWSRFLDLVGDAVGTEARAALAALPERGGAWRWEGLRRDGSVWLAMHAEAGTDALGQAQVEGAVQNITERKQAELAARAAQQRAEQAVAVRDRFIAVLSHEMRNPLQGLLGGLELMLETRDPARKDDYARLALQGGRLLLRLLDDILTVAKIESGRFEIHPLPADLRQVARNLEQMYGLRARQLGLELAIVIDPAMPQVLCIDELRLTQIVGNLVANGLKFTPKGGVRVHFGWQAQDAARGTLAIAVSDTGIGIPSELRARLFQPFAQADARVAGLYGGTGLGLWVCASLLKLMGGTIGIEDRPGGGTIFRIELPAAVACPMPAAAPPPASPAVPRLSGHILLIEDDLVNRTAIMAMLHALNLRCTAVASAEEALERWQRQAAEFALVITDLGLPGMDGRTLVHHLQSLSACPVPCIAVSGDDPGQDLPALLADGFSSVLVKPITVDALRAALQPFLAERPAAPPA